MNSQNNNHWFGSTVFASTYLQSGEYQPVLVLWTRGTSVLSSELVHPDESQSALERTLNRALAQDKHGPELLLVENSESMEALRALVPTVDFEVGSDDFVAVMAEDMMEGMPELDRPDTYFEKDTDVAALRGFFSGMKALLDAEVLVEDDCHFVSVNIPSLNIENAVLWLGIDSCSLGYGFVLFPSIELFRAFMNVNLCMTHTWEDSDDRSVLRAGFVSQRFVSKPKRREVKKNSLVIRDGLYPSLNAHDASGVRTPANRRDYHLARLLAQGVSKLQCALREKTDARFRFSLMHDGTEHEAQFVYPASEVIPDDYRFTNLEF